MEIALFGNLETLAKALEEKGVSSAVFDAGSTPSLTAMLVAHTDIISVVMCAEELGRWSDGHILAAAKALQSKGRFLILGESAEAERLKCSPLVICVSSIEDALKLLLRPKGGAAALAAKVTMGETTSAPVAELEFDARRLKGSESRIYSVAVHGSQPRIGCTTQALGLWHYFKAVGLSSAIVATESQIHLLEETVANAKRDGDCVTIDGIPFLPEPDKGLHDIYIWDAPNVSCEKLRPDAVLLVAGCKPWELYNTIEAMNHVPQDRTAILLSFATEETTQGLRKEIREKGIEVDIAPYMPDPWAEANASLLRIYDALLRPILERKAPDLSETEEDELESWFLEDPQEIL